MTEHTPSVTERILQTVKAAEENGVFIEEIGLDPVDVGRLRFELEAAGVAVGEPIDLAGHKLRIRYRDRRSWLETAG